MFFLMKLVFLPTYQIPGDNITVFANKMFLEFLYVPNPDVFT